jgi:hypothetical protein
MRDLEELFYPYWAEHPPVHILVQAFLGAGKGKPRQRQPDDPRSLFAAQGFTAGDAAAGLATAPVYDFAQLKAATAHG